MLFFTLDILVESRFQVFGMMPYKALTSAVSLYTLFMIRASLGDPRVKINRSVAVVWIVFLAGICIYHFFQTTFGILWNRFIATDYMFALADKCDALFLIGGLLVFIISYLGENRSATFRRWLLLSAGATAFTFIGPVLVKPMPMMLFRYEGLLGMPMIFGWLMISLTILNMKYDPGLD